MKKLVLSSLMLATIASQATGCIITSDDDDGGPGGEAVVTADWRFVDVSGRGEPVVETDCPAGYNTVRLINQEIDANNRPIGSPIIDLFDCIDGRHASAPLPAAVYETRLEVLTDGQGSKYADSLSAIVDVVDTDKTYSAEIVNNGGYFQASWQLEDAAGRLLSCADEPDIDGVEIVATVSGSTGLINDKFNCEDGFGVTAAFREGPYEIAVDAFTDAGAGGSIGETTTLGTQTIRDRNQITNLGTVSIVIP